MLPDQLTFKVQRLLVPRPPEAPPGWIVLAAPRPIMASFGVDGRPCLWDGDFTHGRFYAAVDLENADGYTWNWLVRNAEDDAWICEYITQADIDAWAAGFARAQGLDLTRFDTDAIRQSYFVHNGYTQLRLARTPEGKAAVVPDVRVVKVQAAGLPLS